MHCVCKGSIKGDFVSSMCTPILCAGLPTVRFVSGKVTVVGPERWSVRTGGGAMATRKQLPLKLAWAMSIHKSQVATCCLLGAHMCVRVRARVCVCVCALDTTLA